MPLFKICTSIRVRRKVVKADTVQELLRKGIENFSSDVSIQFKKLVTEKDGCEIEDDDVLLEMNSDLIMLLGDNERWSPSEISPVPSASFRTEVTERPGRGENCDKTDYHVEPSGGVEDTVGTTAPVSAVPDRLSVPLPRLSSFVEDSLRQGNILSCFNNLITECANYYTSQFLISTSLEYQSVGRQLYAKFPCIKFNTGQEPWTVFCEKLSQKIRNLRFRKLRKSQPETPNKTRLDPKLPRRQSLQQSTGSILSTDDYEQHRKEIETEMTKIKPNQDHIRLLLRETLRNRRSWISTLPPDSWSPLFSAFPCFDDMEHVVYEYRLIRNTENLEEETRNMTQLFQLVAETVKDEDLRGTDAEREIVLINALEKLTAFDKGKGKKSEKVVTVKKNVTDAIIEQAAKTSSLTAPHLLAFLDNENNLMDCVVAGDGQSVFCRTDSILEALLFLVCVYYITDLNYPKIFSQILGTIQHFVLGEVYSGQRSTKLNKFMVRVDSRWKARAVE